MSRFNGPAYDGAMRDVRKLKREEAEKRNARPEPPNHEPPKPEPPNPEPPNPEPPNPEPPKTRAGRRHKRAVKKGGNKK